VRVTLSSGREFEFRFRDDLAPARRIVCDCGREHKVPVPFVDLKEVLRARDFNAQKRKSERAREALPFIGYTTLLVREGGNVLCSTLSRCSVVDKWLPGKGRKNALEQALEILGLGELDRSAIWATFFQLAQDAGWFGPRPRGERRRGIDGELEGPPSVSPHVPRAQRKAERQRRRDLAAAIAAARASGKNVEVVDAPPAPTDGP